MQIIEQSPNLADRVADLCKPRFGRTRLFKPLINMDYFATYENLADLLADLQMMVRP
jgi:hypothetical protein